MRKGTFLIVGRVTAAALFGGTVVVASARPLPPQISSSDRENFLIKSGSVMVTSATPTIEKLVQPSEEPTFNRGESPPEATPLQERQAREGLHKARNYLTSLIVSPSDEVYDHVVKIRRAVLLTQID